MLMLLRLRFFPAFGCEPAYLEARANPTASRPSLRRFAALTRPVRRGRGPFIS
jgi:hypothetical protein